MSARVVQDIFLFSEINFNPEFFMEYMFKRYIYFIIYKNHHFLKKKSDFDVIYNLIGCDKGMRRNIFIHRFRKLFIKICLNTCHQFF